MISGSRPAAMSTAVQGAQRSEARVARAATDIVQGFGAQQNALNEVIAGDPIPAVSSFQADPLTSMVDLKMAAHSYQASLAVMDTVDEMLGTAIDTLK